MPQPLRNQVPAPPPDGGSIQAGPRGQWLGFLEGDIRKERVFDYVVVGGGTAGNAIAVRLAQAGFHVAIVEAGQLYEDLDGGSHVTPGFDLVGVGWSTADVVKSDVDWKFVTEPQHGSNYRRMHVARGRCLGGSSALNFMLYHRATRGSLDVWSEMVGDDSYRFDNLLPFYKRSLSFSPPRPHARKANSSAVYYVPRDFDPAGRGGGPVQIGFTNYVSAWSTWLESGLKSLGMKAENDYNYGRLNGYHYATTTIRPSDGTRSSSAAFVFEAKKQRLYNLRVFLRTQATRILFDRYKRAVAVEVYHDRAYYKLRARKEIIVSAGAYQSPQLLMVSGIGPVETLSRFRIPVVSPLAGVGQNMWDHVFFGPDYAVKFQTRDHFADHVEALVEATMLYHDTGTGPLSSNVPEFLAWEKLPPRYRTRFSPETVRELDGFPPDWPEVEYLSGDGYIGDFYSVLNNQPMDGRMYATILGALVAPLSRGNITIRSASALDPPVIFPNWLEHPADKEVAIAWFRRMRDVWTSPGLGFMTYGPEYYPGPQVQTDQQILDAVRKSLMTVWHPACTCKMGRRGDRTAVVDSQARVFGVSALRVVDASSMPILPPGHPQSTIYALAEKIADDIIREQRVPAQDPSPSSFFSSSSSSPSSPFPFPREYHFPAFFTRQTNLTTHHAQLLKWSALVLAYARHHRIFRLHLSAAAESELFFNRRLDRRLAPADIRHLVDFIRKDGRAEYLLHNAKDPTPDVVLLYWRSLDEWADLVEAYVDDSAQKGSVLTLYELTDGDGTRSTEIHGMDSEVLLKALNVLVKRGKAQIFGQEDSLGIKFF
ncbi:hypothetical protein L249_2724 [Ophiocordyceps polyrhachis-furcata BCC 54312]|uniref:ESCRT-II complex subunit VPS25 n=1 Tax=Ophiocordyceps polyrhachis-furcata BCC 54312 TaxID=1330021 RepID=A0A367LR47_9HYPO|nr:hypothetical protein L249_2724 [Ophiocordyceps polyrhachis-furcata BCC 54312]